MTDHVAIRVVLADGNAKVRGVLRWLLEDDGRFEVVGETANGDEAVSAASRADVVVMEIALRGLDGLTALEQIGRAHPSVGVVIYSSFVQPYLRAEAVARGAAAFIPKSSGYDEIAEALATVAATRT